MAKRRNAKKEKASRNKAYARQFRKKPSGFRSGDRRFSNSNKKSETSETSEEKDSSFNFTSNN
ncbi:hypothetical protein Sta7437_3204 [Stanieria cyanosphaera PCC 7437]|uniref:Uncharacterized protein n=1 Tax=Stanieria cyanosphaera (strain ATCC 29371 / PCC 7437) TaxID=111780 RepID=K9XX85_STAC7|nr:hypothetical protein [Stanieria cyanosphaera]AFZ36711.1 hypothetical protein Sta7437_3204 [Stanieria cyanosphaera PCC 7437]